MKKIIILSILLCFILFTGCGSDDTVILSDLYFSATELGTSQSSFSGYSNYANMTVTTSKPITITTNIYYLGVLIDTATGSILSSGYYSLELWFTGYGKYSVEIVYDGQVKLLGSFTSV